MLSATALAATVPACLGQAGTVAVPLRILDEKPVPSLHLESLGWRAMAGEGDFYVETRPGNYTAVDLKGQTRSALDMAKVPASDGWDPADLHATDLSRDPRGGVLAPVLWAPKAGPEKHGVVRFDDKGDYDSLIWLDAKFFPTHVAKFSSSGDYLVTGYDDKGTVYVSLFDVRGKLLIPQVLSPDSKAAAPAKPGSHSANAEAVQEASLIQIASGDDDAVYLFDRSRGRKVLRIQPSGNFTELALPPPILKDGESTMPMAMLVSHSSIYLYEAVLDKGQDIQDVVELKRFALSVYDGYTGTLNASFRDLASIGGMLVSVAPQEFYFLKSTPDAGGTVAFSLVHAGQ